MGAEHSVDINSSTYTDNSDKFSGQIDTKKSNTIENTVVKVADEKQSIISTEIATEESNRKLYKTLLKNYKIYL